MRKNSRLWISEIVRSVILTLVIGSFMNPCALAAEKKQKKSFSGTQDPQLILLASKEQAQAGDTVFLELQAPYEYGYFSQGTDLGRDEANSDRVYPSRVRFFADGECFCEIEVGLFHGLPENDPWRCHVTVQSSSVLTAAISFDEKDWLYTGNAVSVNVGHNTGLITPAGGTQVEMTWDGLLVTWYAEEGATGYMLTLAVEASEGMSVLYQNTKAPEGQPGEVMYTLIPMDQLDLSGLTRAERIQLLQATLSLSVY